MCVEILLLSFFCRIFVFVFKFPGQEINTSLCVLSQLSQSPSPIFKSHLASVTFSWAIIDNHTSLFKTKDGTIQALKCENRPAKGHPGKV